MMKYVTYDDAGNLTGYFQQPVAADHADCFIEVGDEIAADWALYRANSDRTGIEVAPIAPPTSAQHNAPILAALAAIDAKTIRPLREGDTARVVALEAEAAALRAQLRKD